MTQGGTALIVLGCFGAVPTSTFPMTVVLAQQYMPRNAGLASGLIVGFAIGTGGLGIGALGWMAADSAFQLCYGLAHCFPSADLPRLCFSPVRTWMWNKRRTGADADPIPAKAFTIAAVVGI